MIQYTNNAELPLPLAAWLMDDDYDYNPDPHVISATSLIKQPKKAILSSVIAKSKELIYQMDVADRLPSRRGQGIHQDIENACGKDELVVKTANSLGIATPALMLEQRLQAPIVVNGETFYVSGKFDAVIDRVVTDWKTESVYGWGDTVKLRERQLQLSIYAWLCMKNKMDVSPFRGQVFSIFQDWSVKQAKQAKDEESYPKNRIMPVDIDLLSYSEIEEFMVTQIKAHKFTTVEEAKELTCSPEDLWMKPPVFQYFSKPDGKRASKNFSNMPEAQTYLASKSNVGVIKTKNSFAKACEYCLGAPVCPQYMNLTQQGLIENASNLILVSSPV